MASMGVQQIREYFSANWKLLAAWGALAVVLIIALAWRLNTLVPGYADSEVHTYYSSLSVRGGLDNPLNAPFLLATKALLYLHPHSFLAVRLVSAMGGLIVLAIFATLLRHWHDDRTAIIGTLLFGLSSWFLHTARLGTPDIMQFGVFCLVACGFWLKHTNSWLALFACFAGVAWLLYIPGMIWFVVVGIIWQWKSIDRVFKRHLLVVTAAGLVFLASLAPLVWGLYKHTALIKSFLALPEQWPAPLQIGKNLLLAPFHLFVHNATSPATWLGTAPIFDVFSLAMLILGIYLYLRHWRLARTPVFIMILLVAAGLMAIGSPITFSVIIPLLYLLVAAGVSYLLGMWFMVFPRNPIARGIGWTLAGMVIGLVCVYHITHYFIGWPQATATHVVFTAQKP
jgi:hypothetical protein